MGHRTLALGSCRAAGGGFPATRPCRGGLARMLAVMRAVTDTRNTSVKVLQLIVEFDHLKQLHVLLAFDPPRLHCHLRNQPLKPLCQRLLSSAHHVGVEPYEHPFSAVQHVQVVVPDLLVFFVVTPVPPLVSLDSQNRVPDELPVVNSPPVCAVAVCRIDRVVVDEALKVGRQRVPHRNLLRVLVDHRRPRVLRKLAFEAAGTVPVDAHLVLFLSAVAVCPGYALGAAPAAAMLLAIVSLTLRALSAASLGASPAAAMLDALVGLTGCTLSAASLDTAPAAAMLLALVGLADCALSAASLGAAPAAAMLDALVGHTLRALSAASLDAAPAAAMLDALVGRTCRALSAASLDTAPAAAVLDALVGLTGRALSAASLDAAPAAAMLAALVGLTDCALSAAGLDTAPAAAVLAALVGRTLRALSAASLDTAPAAAVLDALVALIPCALSAASLDAAPAAALLALQRGRAHEAGHSGERSFDITVRELEGWVQCYIVYCCVVNRIAVDWRHLHS